MDTMEQILNAKQQIIFLLKTTGQKVSKKNILTELLKRFWLSAYQMQQAIQSGSADRVMRFIRENPPEGYSVRQMDKKIEGYDDCLQYKLVKNGSLF